MGQRPSRDVARLNPGGLGNTMAPHRGCPTGGKGADRWWCVSVVGWGCQWERKHSQGLQVKCAPGGTQVRVHV